MCCNNGGIDRKSALEMDVHIMVMVTATTFKCGGPGPGTYLPLSLLSSGMNSSSDFSVFLVE
jgi:hypothetical protein